METMSFYSQSIVGLDDIAEYAQYENYRTEKIRWERQGVEDKHILTVFFGSEKRQWWQWYEMKLKDIYFDDEIARQIVQGLMPKTILLFEYDPRFFPKIIQCLKYLLHKFGGWVDCRGDSKTLYTIENIDTIQSGCP